MEDLQKNAMMAHLPDALEAGHGTEDYGGLAFATVAGDFLTEDTLLTSHSGDTACMPL